MTLDEQKKLKTNLESATILLSEDPSDDDVEQARKLLFEVSEEKYRGGIYQALVQCA